MSCDNECQRHLMLLKRLFQASLKKSGVMTLFSLITQVYKELFNNSFFYSVRGIQDLQRIIILNYSESFKTDGRQNPAFIHLKGENLRWVSHQHAVQCSIIH